MAQSLYLQTQDLSVGYDGVCLIKQISLDIKKGEVVTLIGPNGAGKSTILKSITGHLKHLGGSVFLDKENLYKLSNQECAKKISVVFTQKINTELMTCRELVATGRYPHTGRFGKLTDKDNQIIDEVMKQTDSFSIADRDFSAISDGQRQRLMIARALCQQPGLMVLDEPTSYLDIKYKVELLDMLRKLAKEKSITVLMSLHEIDLASKVSDKIICVKGDSIYACGTPKEVITCDIISSLYNLENDHYNDIFGSVELSAPKGESQIFVIGGNGNAAPFYRELQRRNIPFATGPLSKNDVDFHIAASLSEDVISYPAFSLPEKDVLDKCKENIKKCKCTVNLVSKEPFAPPGMKEIIEYSLSINKPILNSFEEAVSFIENNM